MPVSAKLLGHIFVGGVLGSMLRYLIFELLGSLETHRTYELIALFTVNLAGALFLGITARHPWFQLERRRSFWGVGFAGAFTTMSALTIWIEGHGLGSAVVLMLSLGFALYWMGYEYGRKLERRQS